MRPPNPSLADAIKAAVMSWYDQHLNYDYTTGKAKADKPGATVFAFTALVWKQSTKVGIGAARKSDGYIYIVIQFSPPGNMVGSFVQNVLPIDGAVESAPSPSPEGEGQTPEIQVEVVSPSQPSKNVTPTTKPKNGNGTCMNILFQ